MIQNSLLMTPLRNLESIRYHGNKSGLRPTIGSHICISKVSGVFIKIISEILAWGTFESPVITDQNKARPKLDYDTSQI